MCVQGFRFYLATDVPTKITNLAEGQRGYFILQAENITNFN
jgi:hypothetical protein